jgi:PAS domain S-box-containing protein
MNPKSSLARPAGGSSSVVVGFALTCGVLVSSLWLTDRNTRQLAAAHGEVEHTHHVITGLELLLSTLKDAETGHRGFVISGEPDLLEPYDGALGRVWGELDEVQRLTADNSAQQERLAALRPRIDSALAEMMAAIDLRRSDIEGARAVVHAERGKAQMDTVRTAVAELQSEERRLLADRAERVEGVRRQSAAIVLLTGMVGVLMIGGVFALVRRTSRMQQQATRALDDQKEQLRTTLASIGDAVISTDREGNVTYLNVVAESLTGWTSAEAAAVPLTKVFHIINEVTRQPVENPTLRALSEGVIVGLANHTILIARDGSERPIDDSAAPIRCKEGEIVGAVLVFRDITNRHRSDALLAVQKNVLEMVTTDAPLVEVLSALAAAIERQSSGLACSVLLPGEDGRQIRVVAGPNLPAGYIDFLDGLGIEPPYTGPCSMALDTGEAVIVPDSVRDERWSARWREQMLGHGLRACRTTPILAVDGSVLGTFAVYSQRPDDPVLSEAELIRVATHLAGIAIERRKSEAGQRRSEVRFRELAIASERQRRLFDTVLANTPDLAYVFDLDHRFTYANHALLTMWGRTWDESIGKNCLELGYEPWHAAMHDREIEQVVATKQPIRGEVAFDGTNGRRQYDYIFVPVVGADGTVEAVAGTTRDVTERQEAERAVRAGEERLRTALTAARMVAWEWTPADGKLRVSDNAADVFGLPGGVGLTGIDQGLALLHPDDVAAYRQTFQRAIDERGSYLIRYRLIRPFDGRMIWIEERGHAVFDLPDDAVRLYGVSTDVTEFVGAESARHQAEEALRLSEERFRTLFTTMDEGFCVIEMTFDDTGRATDYRIEIMNPAFEEHTGMNDLVGKSIRQAIPALEEFWYETYGRVASTGEPARFVHDAQAMGGRWFDVSAFRLGGNGSNRVAILFNDITARKKADQEREDLLGLLKEQDRRKDVFLATLAHELRNPLAPIRNGLQLIRMAGASGTIEQARSMMERQLTQLVRLVDDLLDMSRVTSGKLELRRERIELRAVIDAAVETSHPALEQAGHELTLSLPDESIFVNGDHTRLAQVLSNLLNNSAKYTPDGGHVRLAASREGETAIVSVSDDGVGIPPTMLGRVFEMFMQVDRTLERSSGGLGIGLSLVKGLVEMHGGSIEVQSAGEGRGSVFTVRLPMSPAAPAESVALPAALAPIGRRRILVVDDNLDSAESMRHLLELHGNVVRTATDGEAGFTAAEAFRPEVVLMDIGMPRMNGYEACRRMREQPWGKDMLLVALTGWGQEDDRRKTAEAGFDHHFVKPVETAALMELLAEPNTT